MNRQRQKSDGGASALGRLLQARELGIAGILLALMLFMSWHSTAFMTTDNMLDVGMDCSVLVLVSIGMMLVILTGGVDISVGSIMALSGMAVGLLLMAVPGIPPIVAVALGAGVGMVAGSINGGLIVLGNVPPVIVTLGTMSVFRGLTFILCYTFNGGKSVSADRLPATFKAFPRVEVLGLPSLIWFALLAVVGFTYFLNHTMTGRKVYAIGSNAQAARLAGIGVGRLTFLAYLLTGALAGAGGVLWASRLAAAESSAALGFEFIAITAVVLGGVNIAGGSGSVLGVLLGAVLIGTITNSLNLARVSPFWKLAINGAIILLAVIVDKRMSRKSAARGNEAATVMTGKPVVPWEWVLLSIFIVFNAYMALTTRHYLDVYNLCDMTMVFSEKAMLAMIVAFIIITGNIDLSVGSMMALSSVSMAVAFRAGMGIWPAAALGIGVGGLCGLVNGLIIARLRISSIIVTLATFSLYRGIASVMLGDQAVSGFPESFTYLGCGYIGDSPVPFSLGVVVALATVMGLVLHQTRFGRTVYAIGRNERTCYASGIPVARAKALLFTLSGLFAGVAAMFLTSRIGNTRPNIATGFELEVITIVILGGVMISGGAGKFWGVMLSVFLVGTIRYGIGLHNINAQYMFLIIGGLLIISILINNLTAWLTSQRELARAIAGARQE
ncbi:hypothetical protein HQ560_09645 [bacterium]|nr:hypothetical protein [bacterium]